MEIVPATNRLIYSKIPVGDMGKYEKNNYKSAIVAMDKK